MEEIINEIYAEFEEIEASSGRIEELLEDLQNVKNIMDDKIDKINNLLSKLEVLGNDE